MTRIDAQQPAAQPNQTQQSSNNDSAATQQAGEKSAFAQRLNNQRQDESKKQDAASSSKNAQTSEKGTSESGLLQKQAPVFTGRGKGTVADLQARLEKAQPHDGKGKHVEGEKGGLEGVGEGKEGFGLEMEGGGLSGLKRKALDSKDADLANLQVDGQPMLQRSMGGPQTATVNVQGSKIPQGMLDKMVEHARVGVNAAGNPEMQFDLKGDVLGGMKMRMSMENGKLTAVFVAENSEVRKFIDGNLQDLRKHLEDRGVKIANLEVRDPEEDRRRRQRDQNNKDRKDAWG